MRRHGVRKGRGGKGSAASERALRLARMGFVSGLILVLAGNAASAQECSTGLTTERVSVSSDGQQGNERSVLPAVSADGCSVAFKSYATNLVANDLNGKVDVFVRDRAASTTRRVPFRPVTGAEPNDNSFPPALSHDGSMIAFGSLSTNLAPRDFNMSPDVFLYESDSDIATPLTIVFDQNGEGIGGGGVPDLPPSASASGQVVAFSSSSDDLVPNDDNGLSDVFVFVNDLDAAPRELMSVATVGALAGQAANGRSAGAAISADGCVVAFYSEATNLLAGDTNGVQDVYVRDRCAQTTELISVSSTGERANGPSQSAGFLPSVSADGRYVVFSSDASNLDPADDNGLTDVFVRDRQAGTTRLVSKNSGGQAGNGPSQYGSVSADGRFVAFQSEATNLVEGDTNARTDVFAADLESGEVQRVSVTSTGGEANGASTAPQISADGITVVFQSSATNLVADDTNPFEDVFASINKLSFTATPTVGPPTPTPTGPTPTPTAGDFCNAMCEVGQTCRRQFGEVILPGVCLPDQDCVCFVEATPTATFTSGTGTPTPTPTGPTATPTGPTPTPTGPTPTPTAGDFCNAMCQAGQTCRRQVVGQIIEGVCLPEQNCVCSVEVTASATPTRTPTGPTPTPTAARKKKGGGGCNCRIDPDAGNGADSAPLSALLIPAVLMVWRMRQRRA